MCKKQLLASGVTLCFLVILTHFTFMGWGMKLLHVSAQLIMPLPNFTRTALRPLSTVGILQALALDTTCRFCCNKHRPCATHSTQGHLQCCKAKSPKSACLRRPQQKQAVSPSTLLALQPVSTLNLSDRFLLSFNIPGLVCSYARSSTHASLSAPAAEGLAQGFCRGPGGVGPSVVAQGCL